MTLRINTRMDHKAFGRPVLRTNPAKWNLYETKRLDQPRLPLERIKVSLAARFHQTSQPLDMGDRYLLQSHYRGIGLKHFGTHRFLGGTPNQTNSFTWINGNEVDRPHTEIIMS